MINSEFKPIILTGTIVKGYGRGGKQLGFPTANIDPKCFKDNLDIINCDGVYYGWCLLNVAGEVVEPMVMSIGWNPHFNNDSKSVEVHILKEYNEDFYGKEISLVLLGFIRPMLKYSTLKELIDAINNDITIAHDKLSQPCNQPFKDSLINV